MSTTETIAPTGTWALDPVHSLVGFEVSYMAGTFRGQFRDVSVSLAIGDDGNAALEGVANVASVDVKDENLDAHLQSPDFFDSENFPELRFAAEDVALEGDHVTANGEITIKGVTKPVTVPGQLGADGGSVGQPALRPHPECGGRSHRLRPQVEQPAAERRCRPGERG